MPDPSPTQRDDQLAEMLGRDLQTLARRIHDRLSPLRSIDPGVANVLIGLVERFPSLLSENAVLRAEVDRLRATVERVEAALVVLEDSDDSDWPAHRRATRSLRSALAAPVEGTEK